MSGDHSKDHYDLLVLGAGVIGLSCVREIRRRHPWLRLALLDAPTGAVPASRAAAGMLAPYAEIAEDSPLARWCAESYEMYPAFVGELERETRTPVGFHREGTLVPVAGQEDVVHIQTRAAQWTRRSVPWRWVEGDALRRAEPALARDVSLAVWLPGGGVNSRQLHTALLASVRATAVSWIEGVAAGVHADGDKVVGIELADGRVVHCRALLAATGAWTTPVAELLGLRFRLRPIKGQMARVAAPDNTLRHVIHGAGVYMAPWVGHGIVIGSTMEDVGFDTSVNADTIASLRARAVDLVPAIEGLSVAESWSGFRPRADDGLPIVGWAARWCNVMVATGHFRNGILLTPATAHAVANLYENPNDVKWRAFSPERPGVTESSNETAS